METFGRDVAILLWEPQNNRFEELKWEGWNNRTQNNSQDVYQVVKYYIKRDKLVFISENKVECLGKIINLLETLYSKFKMQEKVATAYK